MQSLQRGGDLTKRHGSALRTLGQDARNKECPREARGAWAMASQRGGARQSVRQCTAAVWPMSCRRDLECGDTQGSSIG